MKKILLYAALAIGGGFAALAGAHVFGWTGSSAPWPQSTAALPAQFTHYTPGNSPGPVADFTFAAQKTLPVVVHIQSSLRSTKRREGMSPFDFQSIPEPFRQFFGNPGQLQPDQPEDKEGGTGSGVLISPDGYIVTNNHVVEGADKLTVTLQDKHAYTADIVGTDPSSDLALIKIDVTGMPYASFGNSDEAKVGEWVVAVGNPFNLTSTVTAGIVSAKGRDLHIVEDQAPIESFIQTDAVVNPGNSGGALVNLNGELIGINTAIASPTGVFAGYAFAIPANLVAKVVADLRNYGVVQRGYLGITIRSIDANLAREKNLASTEGVWVDSLAEGSAAGAAGLRAGDVITAIDGQAVSSSPALLERIGKHRPGDQVKVTVQRKGTAREFTVTLKNRAGTTELVKKSEQPEALRALGAEFSSLSKTEAQKLGLPGGVKITALGAGRLAQQTDVRAGFVITKINRRPVQSLDDMTEALESSREGGVMFEGIYPDKPGEMHYFAFGL